MKKGEVKMFKRHRKLRKNEVIRNLVKDVYISKDDLIYPIFVEEGENIKSEIPSMPGIFRYSIDRLSEELDELVKLGINSILLFGIPEKKDACATEAYNENGIIQNGKITNKNDKVSIKSKNEIMSVIDYFYNNTSELKWKKIKILGKMKFDYVFFKNRWSYYN